MMSSEPLLPPLQYSGSTAILRQEENGDRRMELVGKENLKKGIRKSTACTLETRASYF